MTRLERREQLSPSEQHAVGELCARIEELSHHEALSEHKWIELRAGAKGFRGYLVYDEAERLVAYGQLSARSTSFGIEYLIDPQAVEHGFETGSKILAAALDDVDEMGGGTVQLFVPLAGELDDSIAYKAGLRPKRQLYQLRRSLPLRSDEKPSTHLELRAFRPGEDEVAWLAVNARAFVDHLEQGAFDLDELLAREREDWFDPEGFLLAFDNGRLIGFCWTKIEPAQPHQGEIYVIGTDPAVQGRGLGKALLLAGLCHLELRGVSEAFLYVDADNEKAMGLYRSMGFHLDHIDRVYATDRA